MKKIIIILFLIHFCVNITSCTIKDKKYYTTLQSTYNISISKNKNNNQTTINLNIPRNITDKNIILNINIQ